MTALTSKPKKAKPTPGHKCGRLQQWVSVRCECGWASDMLRRNELAAIYDQWRRHVATHTAAGAQ